MGVATPPRWGFPEWLRRMRGSGIFRLCQETFVPDKIPLSLPVSRNPSCSVPSSSLSVGNAFKNENSRQRSGALRSTRGQGAARAASLLGRPRGRGRPEHGCGRQELGGSNSRDGADQDQTLPDSLSELLVLVRSEVQHAQQTSTGAPAPNPSPGTDAAGLNNQLVTTAADHLCL